MSQPPEAATLAGVVERMLFHNPETGYSVVRIRHGVEEATATIVGALPPLRPGEVVRVTGAWRDDAAWGRRLAVDGIEILSDATTQGVVSWLASGVIPHVGDALAERLVERFGDELPKVIAEAPERLREVAGIGEKLATRIAQAWQQDRSERELLLFLHSHGLGTARAKAIREAYGEQAIARIGADPYALARDVRGVGFLTADAIAMAVGIAPVAPERRLAALEHVLREAAEQGNTGLPAPLLLARAGELLGQDAEALEGALEAGLAAGHMELDASVGELVQLRPLALAERRAAVRLTALAVARPAWAGTEPERAIAAAEAALGMALAPSQILAVRRALDANVLVVTGGPGTGKTTLVRAILAAVRSAGGVEDRAIVLCAPTGRAARRLTESTGLPARTIHRLLEADPARGFRRTAARRIEADLVVCDEASMVDILLLQALLEALPETASLLLVGDADQLPSVGPGQILADIIASDAVPVVRLTEIFRQAETSAIVRNAHAINRGEAPRFEHAADGSGDFYGVRAESVEDAIAKVLDLVTRRIPERFGFDPLSEIQVLVPVNRGPVGTRELNTALGRALNPTPPAVLERGERRLAVGDKVMQIENDYEREVYNGDIGRITAIDERGKSVAVAIDGRPLAYGFDELDALQPAWAVTVHKAQGSEYPAVVVLLMRQHGRMLRRRLLYTAITRARRLVVLVAEPLAIERALRHTDAERRLTLLEPRLRAVGAER